MKFTDEGITLHQSDLKHPCMEHLRLQTLASGPRMETDAATVGTCMHHAIESELREGPFNSEEEAVGWAAGEYIRVLEEYQESGASYVMSSFNNHTAAVLALDRLVRSWYNCDDRIALMASHETPLVEWHFDLPFSEVQVKKHGKKAEVIPVRLAGTADLVWSNQVWDWKSAGSEYKRWEYQRWGRQPDVYTWAAAQSGLIFPDAQGLYDFKFKVFVRRAEIRPPQTVDITRSPKNWEWLGQTVDRVVNHMYNMGLETPWVMDDQHVLCSPKWCPFWDQCKGKFVSGESWT